MGQELERLALALDETRAPIVFRRSIPLQELPSPAGGSGILGGARRIQESEGIPSSAWRFWPESNGAIGVLLLPQKRPPFDHDVFVIQRSRPFQRRAAKQKSGGKKRLSRRRTVGKEFFEGLGKPFFPAITHFFHAGLGPRAPRGEILCQKRTRPSRKCFDERKAHDHENALL